MDDAALRTRLSRIERLLFVVVGLLLVRLLRDVAGVLGGWVTAVLVALVGVVAVAGLVSIRRRGRNADAPEE
ncbi:hypothetical protein C2R22_19240 [Salinigranum rubrum]|uniref:Uncharacterized protein n=1 Tax=Salinigranum rubrum TaxID=755307 RepID=A0A2I8VNL4_9EURY|nr:hypothetical protein [Salinigranum rubrum]AUV83511.1 hypothetical protein C2R22_19240 [Salinigranum rubrum]